MNHHDTISRVTRSKEEAKASYDSLSRWYDVLTGWGERKFRKIGLQKLAAREGEKILEIGFGTGYCILALARAVGNSGKICGLDISEGMRNIAQSRIERADLAKRVELKMGDAARLPFEADSFDAVFMSFTLELFDTPEIPIVLQQCQKVLKSGGRIGVVAMSKEGKSNSLVRLYEWSHARFPHYVDCRPIYVRQALDDAGFHILDTTKLSYWGIPVEVVVARKGLQRISRNLDIV
ncbi:MAG: methyltransferase domain-containing protein [Chloroflexi bacterium]|nr:methyltransferase domain-containing protein [Chloroflexota bacterium]